MHTVDRNDKKLTRIRYRPGLSLLEVLVVVAVIGLMLGLMLPAVEKVREAAMMTQDRNQLRQLGIAMQQYAALQDGALPGWKRPSIVPGGTSQVGAVLYELLPFMEPPCPPPYFTDDNGSDEYHLIRAFLSPSDPTNTPELLWISPFASGGASSYVANAQVFGPMPDLVNSIPDGTSQTIALTQRYLTCKNRPNWTVYSGCKACSDDAPPDCTYDSTRSALFADPTWQDVVPVVDSATGQTVASVSGLTFQVKPAIGDADGRMVQATYASGLITCMFDGHVVMFSPSTTESIFWSAVTPAGGEVGDDY